MKPQKYMVLLVDKQKASMFTLENGVEGKPLAVFDDQVPQKVKHGDDTWDAQNKIFRHIEDHLHRHLTLISQIAATFAKTNQVDRIVIGGHKPLFAKIEKHLPYPLPAMVRGRFVTELKVPLEEILVRAKRLIHRIEILEQKIGGR